MVVAMAVEANTNNGTAVKKKNNNTNHNYYLIASTFSCWFYFPVLFYLFWKCWVKSETKLELKFTMIQPHSHIYSMHSMHTIYAQYLHIKIRTIFFTCFFSVSHLYSYFPFAPAYQQFLQRSHTQSKIIINEEKKVKQKKKKKWNENGIGRRGNDYNASARNGKYFEFRRERKKNRENN